MMLRVLGAALLAASLATLTLLAAASSRGLQRTAIYTTPLTVVVDRQRATLVLVAGECMHLSFPTEAYTAEAIVRLSGAATTVGPGAGPPSPTELIHVAPRVVDRAAVKAKVLLLQGCPLRREALPPLQAATGSRDVEKLLQRLLDGSKVLAEAEGGLGEPLPLHGAALAGEAAVLAVVEAPLGSLRVEISRGGETVTLTAEEVLQGRLPEGLTAEAVLRSLLVGVEVLLVPHLGAGQALRATALALLGLLLAAYDASRRPEESRGALGLLRRLMRRGGTPS